MTIAMDIIQGKMPEFKAYIQAGESLDDIDEFGFTPLIEAVIARRDDVLKALLQLRVDVNKPDMAGRTALQWAVDMEAFEACQLLLNANALPNSVTRQGFSALIYPILRQEQKLKHLLLSHGANLHFAQDFMTAKLLGHRFSLTGYVDIVHADKMIEIDYEGFVLEFSVAMILNSLSRFINNYQARKWQNDALLLQQLVSGLQWADKLLTYQRLIQPERRFHAELAELLKQDFLVLPVASSGHAMGFIRYKNWLAKIDRGENSHKEGSVNIYEINKPYAFNVNFLDDFIFRKQARKFFHEDIIPILGLNKIANLPMSSQTSGNCSWANIEACVAVGFWMLLVYPDADFQPKDAGLFYQEWLSWDRARAIEETIQTLEQADKFRKASLLAMLAAVLFQFLDSKQTEDIELAEQILKPLLQKDYLYIIQSYLDVYCEQSQRTAHGENLKHLLDNCGYDSAGLGLDFNPKI